MSDEEPNSDVDETGIASDNESEVKEIKNKTNKKKSRDKKLDEKGETSDTDSDEELAENFADASDNEANAEGEEDDDKDNDEEDGDDDEADEPEAKDDAGDDECYTKQVKKKKKYIDENSDDEDLDVPDIQKEQDTPTALEDIKFVDKSERISDNCLTFYELTRLVGTRLTQINAGAKVMLNIKTQMTNLEKVIGEIKKKTTPIDIIRPLANNKFELWTLDEMQNVDMDMLASIIRTS